MDLDRLYIGSGNYVAPGEFDLYCAGTSCNDAEPYAALDDMGVGNYGNIDHVRKNGVGILG